MDEEYTPPSETEQAEILSQPTPGHVVAMRNEDLARRMYPNNSEFGSVVPDNAFDGADLPASKRSAAVANLRGMFADTGLAPAEAAGLFNRAAIVRSEGKSTEQQVKAARGELDRIFGKDGSDQALADARKLITRDPRLAKWIESKGLGNDPETIVQFARQARSQRYAGKLK